MSDTATNGSLDSFLLDGDAPRLGAATPMQPSPSVLDYELLAAEPSVAAQPPVSGSMLLPPRIDAEPVLLALDGPSLPTAAPKAPTAPAGGDDGAEPRHAGSDGPASASAASSASIQRPTGSSPPARKYA